MRHGMQVHTRQSKKLTDGIIESLGYYMTEQKMGKRGLPSETSLDDVKVRIREAYNNSNVGKIHQIVLKEGPRIFRIATLLEIMGKAGELHHYSLKIDTIDKLKKAGWFSKPEKSVRLDGDDPNEIEHLYRFLNALIEGKLSKRIGELHIIGSDEYKKLENLLDIIPSLASSDKIELIKAILPRIEGASNYTNDFISAFNNSDPETIRHISIAARVVEYKKAYEQLNDLINADSSEQTLQDHLKKFPWMFGSEYSELLDRRTWVRDNKLDFMLRRNADNFLEIIEIKTPFKDSLMLYDKSHDSFYPSSKLSTVLGQVMRYIEETERARDLIRSKDKLDTLKIRARIIIGRDGEESHQIALRNLNSHLHRIEIITFDQLLRIAARVLAVFGKESPNSEATYSEIPDDEIPF
jgi:hypothetical protein